MRTVEDEERARNNPRITLRDADGGPPLQPNIHAVAAQARQRQDRARTASESLDRERSRACRATTSTSRRSTPSAAG